MLNTHRIKNKAQLKENQRNPGEYTKLQSSIKKIPYKLTEILHLMYLLASDYSRLRL